MDQIGEGLFAQALSPRRSLRERNNSGEKEVPRGRGRQPHVVIAVVIPVVVDVHTTLVDVEFDAVVIGEREFTQSRPRAPGVEAYRLAAYALSSLNLIREQPRTRGIPPLRMSKKFLLDPSPLATVLRGDAVLR